MSRLSVGGAERTTSTTLKRYSARGMLAGWEAAGRGGLLELSQASALANSLSVCHLTARNSPRELSDAATARRQTAAAGHDAARHAASRNADAAAGSPAAAGHVNNVLRTYEEKSGLDAPSQRTADKPTHVPSDNTTQGLS